MEGTDLKYTIKGDNGDILMNIMLTLLTAEKSYLFKGKVEDGG